MASRDAHLGDKPIKKFKKMPNGKVRTGTAIQGGKVLGQERQQRGNFLEPCFLIRKAGCSYEMFNF